MLFVGDDWAEDHHDVEVMDPAGRRLAAARLPEGVAGITRLHAMIGAHLGEPTPMSAEVVVGIETDRGPWVQALIAAGYRCIAVNPLQAARYRERHTVSGAKSDTADAHMLADMVRTDSHQLRPVAGGQPRGRGGQSRGPGAQDADLGTHPPQPAAAPRAAGVLPRRAGGLRRPRPPPTPWTCWPRPPTRRGGTADHRADHARRSTAPAAATSTPRGSSDPGRAAQPSTWASRLR